LKHSVWWTTGVRQPGHKRRGSGGSDRRAADFVLDASGRTASRTSRRTTRRPRARPRDRRQ